MGFLLYIYLHDYRNGVFELSTVVKILWLKRKRGKKKENSIADRHLTEMLSKSISHDCLKVRSISFT